MNATETIAADFSPLLTAHERYVAAVNAVDRRAIVLSTRALLVKASDILFPDGPPVGPDGHRSSRPHWKSFFQSWAELEAEAICCSNRLASDLRNLAVASTGRWVPIEREPEAYPVGRAA